MNWTGYGNIAVYQDERTVLIAPSFDIPLALAQQQATPSEAPDPFRGMPFYAFKNGDFISILPGKLRFPTGVDGASIGSPPPVALYAEAPTIQFDLNGFPAGQTSLIYIEYYLEQPAADSQTDGIAEKLFAPVTIGVGEYFFRFNTSGHRGGAEPLMGISYAMKFAAALPADEPNIFRHPIALVTTDSGGIAGKPRQIHIGPIDMPLSWELFPVISAGEAD